MTNRPAAGPLAIALLIAAVARGPLAAGEAADIVRRHLDRFKTLTSLTLRVERQVTRRGKTTTERWTLYQKGPARFRLDFEFPVRRLITINERELWEYVPRAKRAARTDLSGLSPDERAELLRQVLKRVAVPGLRLNAGGPQAELIDRGTATVQGRPVHRIECRGREGNGRSARGAIDAERLVLLRCEFLDEDGHVVATTEADRVFEAAPGFWFPRRVAYKGLGGRGLTQTATFKRVAVNAALEDALFEFAVPDGVEVVEMNPGKP